MKGKYYLNRFINSQNNKQVPSVHLDKERYVYTPAFIANKKQKTLIAFQVDIVDFKKSNMFAMIYQKTKNVQK